MEQRIMVSTGSPWESIVGYSRAVRIGNRIEVSGTTAMDGDLVVGENDAYEQTVHALKIIEQSLAKLGAKMTDVVRTRMFVADISKWKEIGKAHGEFFREIRPVTTMVEVKALIDPRLLVEIEAEAAIAESF